MNFPLYAEHGPIGAEGANELHRSSLLPLPYLKQASFL
jgi:hypothetical protein